MSKLHDSVYRFDALDTAQKITGKKYQNDKETESLATLLHLSHSRNQEQMLKQMNDTTFSMGYKAYLDIVKDLGFVQVDEWVFSSKYHSQEQFSHWLLDGMYLIVESFNEYNSRNRAELYFAWKSDKRTYDVGIECSQRYYKENGVTISLCSLDARVGLRHSIEVLKQHGTFVNPFPEPYDFISIPYGDYEAGEYRQYCKAKAKRLKMLHPEIKKLLNLV